MFHIEFRFAEAEERQARFRADAERARFGGFRRRRFRHRMGDSIVRFGRRIGGETATTPAWQG